MRVAVPPKATEFPRLLKQRTISCMNRQHRRCPDGRSGQRGKCRARNGVADALLVALDALRPWNDRRDARVLTEGVEEGLEADGKMEGVGKLVEWTRCWAIFAGLGT